MEKGTTMTSQLMQNPKAMQPYIFIGCVFSYLVFVEVQILYKLMVKSFLMPFLMVWVYANFGTRAPPLIYTSLVFATFGDIFLDVHTLFNNQGPWFIIGMGSFLAMQVCYIKTFRALPCYRGPSTLSIAFYIVLWSFLIYVIVPNLSGDLQLPVLGYTIFLGVMACLSSGVNSRMGWGGFIFLASDAMIGVSIAGFKVPYMSVIIITTYLIA